MTLGIAGALDVTLKYLRRNCVQAELAESHSVSQPTISRATTAVTDTHAYAAKSKKDILRCLKRAIAREVFHLITHPQPVQSAADLRPARRQLGLTITDVANALGCGIAKISRIERGHIRDTRFLHDYRDWLISQQSLRTAA